MNQLSLDHPSVEQLAAFGLGRLDEAESATIEEHLSACDTCCDIVDKAAPDSLVHQIKAAPEPLSIDGATATPSGNEAAAPGHPVPLAEAGTLAMADPMPSGQGTNAATEPAAGIFVADIPAELANHSRYSIQELLGTGGMGAVYKAEHRLMKRSVALKVINPKFMQSKQAVERFRREVQAAARLHHPNIVTAHDAEQAGDLHYLVMEYVAGTDLGKLLEASAGGGLPVAEACDYIRQAALGLQHAHENGMVHRDIKPQNLMVLFSRDAIAERGASRSAIASRLNSTVKILDFGLASLVTEVDCGDAASANQKSTIENQKSGLTQAGSIMGTPDYMAPEQGRDARTADIRSDIYSLGCTLYALLSGKVPFPGGTAIDKVIAHAGNKPQPIGELRKDVPAALVRILDQMMAKDPAQRYQTPAEVATALAPLSPLGLGAGGEGRSHSRKRGALLTAAAGLVLLLGGIIYVATDNGQLVIETNVDDVQVVIKKGGNEFEVIDLKTGSKVKRLPTGAYTISLTGNTNGVIFDPKDGFTMTRRGDVTVKVSRESAAGPRDEDLLQGTWKIISVERAGKTIPMEVLKKAKFSDFIIRGNDWDAVSPDEKILQNSFKINRRTDPKEIDVEVALFGGGPDAPGIYKLEGDAFTLCVAEPGQPRPTEFTTKGDREHILIVARRATPAELGWVQLFNGKDLTGWRVPEMNNVWSVEDGLLVGRGNGNNLVNDREFSENFDLRCEAKISAQHWGKVKMRLDADGTGYGIPIRGPYWAQGVNKMTISPETPGTPRPPADVWFDYEISARGPDVKIKINGNVVARLSGLTVRRGRLALETMWPKPPPTIQFRKIEIKELPAVVAAATDEERIQGKWRLIAGEFAGRTATLEEISKCKLVFKDETMKLDIHIGKESMRLGGNFTLDARKEPKRLIYIIQGESKLAKGAPSQVGKAGHGIYRFEGERLVICLTEGADSPPTEFKTSAKTPDQFLLTLERHSAVLKSDKELILGAWKPASAEAFGQPVPQALIDLMQPTITFTPDKLTAKVNLDKMPVPIDMLKKLLMGFDEKEKTLTPKELATVLEKQGVEAVYTIDPTKTPKTINISYLSPVRKTLVGIYSIEGDTLKICVAVEPERAEERPTEFIGKAGQVLGILKRQPK